MAITPSKFQVFFSALPVELSSLKDYTAVISPASSEWNDFGYQTRCNLVARASDDSVLAAKIHIAFLLRDADAKNNSSFDSYSNSDARVIYSVINQSNDPSGLRPASEFPEFFTMLQTMQAYRDSVSILGVELANSLLLEIHDIVAHEEAKRPALWKTPAVESEPFTYSFVRDMDTYFAYKQAGRILGGLDQEVVGDISKEIYLTFQSPAFENPHSLKFRFETEGDFPRRVSVVIGRNGVGKSQSLSRLVEALLSQSSAIHGPDNSRILIGRILAFTTPSESRLTFPSEGQTRHGISYRKFVLNRTSPRGRGPAGVPDLIVQIARSRESIATRDRWDLLTKALEKVLPLGEIGLPIRRNISGRTAEMIKPFISARAIPIPLLRNDGEQQLLARWGAVSRNAEPVHLINGEAYPLSSGQLSFIRFAAQTALYIENGTLVILDEPESHLHPNFISSFMQVLENLLETTGSVAIVATHSAYFVREVFRDQVQILREIEPKRISIETPRLRTFGADIGAISYFVFGEQDSGQLLKLVEAMAIKRGMSLQDIEQAIGDELSMEAKMSIQRTMDQTYRDPE